MRLQLGLTLCLLLLSNRISAVDVEREEFSTNEKKTVENAADYMTVERPPSAFPLRARKEARSNDSMMKDDYNTFDTGEKVGESSSILQTQK
jgi:hypothetical protein